MSNPFDTKEKVELFEEAGDLLKAAKTLEGQVRLAKKTKNAGWLEKLGGYAKRTGVALGNIAKQALAITILNGVIELCNMILSAVLKSLSERKAAYGVTTPAQSSQTNYNDPFTRQYGSSATTMSW
jgi:hypothetical protein